MDTIYAATCITLLVFIASVFSVELALSAAIIEIAVGVVAGNFLGLESAPWMDFLAGFGGILLTFLAGAEVDPKMMREKFKESVLIGGMSFMVPYLAAIACCRWVAGWTWNASLDGFSQLHKWLCHSLPSKNISTRRAAHGHALDLDAAALGKGADLDNGPGRPVV